MHKILQNHILCAFLANLKIDALYALYPESFCGKNLAFRNFFAFSYSAANDYWQQFWISNMAIFPYQNETSRSHFDSLDGVDHCGCTCKCLHVIKY